MARTMDNTTLDLAEAMGAPRRARSGAVTQTPRATPFPRWGRWLALGVAALLVLGCVGFGLVFLHGFTLVPRIGGATTAATGAPMPANEAEARQDVIGFYQKTLQQRPEDWYWSSTSPGDAGANMEGHSGSLFGQWKFWVGFWLRGDVVDTSTEAEHDYPFFDRLISVWERIGWTKTTEKSDSDGTRYVNGHTDTGLEVDLSIARSGGIGSISQIKFPGPSEGRQVHDPDGSFPRKITRNGPAPWTPPPTN